MLGTNWYAKENIYVCKTASKFTNVDPQNDTKMTPRWSQAGPRWSQGPQIPNCFEMGLEMTPKWSQFGVHVGVFFWYVWNPFFRVFPKTCPKTSPKFIQKSWKTSPKNSTENCSEMAQFWAPKWFHHGLQNYPKTAHDAPKASEKSSSRSIVLPC